MDYSSYKDLKIRQLEPGILEIVMGEEGKLAVATARVYRGMHNVSDVVCGALLGASCIVVGYVAVRAGLAAATARREDQPIERPEGSYLEEAV